MSGVWQYVPKPQLHCSKCNKAEEDCSWGNLFDITLLASEDEEGHTHITQYFCDICLDEVVTGLKTLGFINHEHGDTCAFQDDDCPGGYENCPTPTEYGHVYRNGTNSWLDHDGLKALYQMKYAK